MQVKHPTLEAARQQTRGGQKQLSDKEHGVRAACEAALLSQGRRKMSGSVGDLLLGRARSGVLCSGGRVGGDALGTIHSISGDDSGLPTWGHNSTLLRPTAGNGCYTQRLEISLHYNLLGLHTHNISYLVSRERSATIFFLHLFLRRKE